MKALLKQAKLTFKQENPTVVMIIADPKRNYFLEVQHIAKKCKVDDYIYLDVQLLKNEMNI